MSEVCRSCNQPVIWTETVNGKRMPVNAEPDPKGNLFLVPRIHGPPLAVAIQGRKWTASLDYGEPPPREEPKLYVSHFAKCPQSKHWRKRT